MGTFLAKMASRLHCSYISATLQLCFNCVFSFIWATFRLHLSNMLATFYRHLSYISNTFQLHFSISIILAKFHLHFRQKQVDYILNTFQLHFSFFLLLRLSKNSAALQQHFNNISAWFKLHFRYILLALK